jgi:hypothetical protein
VPCHQYFFFFFFPLFSTNHSYVSFVFRSQYPSTAMMMMQAQTMCHAIGKFFLLFSSFFSSPLTNLFSTIRFQDGVALGRRGNFPFPSLSTDPTMTTITVMNPCKCAVKKDFISEREAVPSGKYYQSGS